MSCLDATFTLTPRSPSYTKSNYWSGPGLLAPDWALLSGTGVENRGNAPNDLSSLYASNRFYFSSPYASDPNLDYSQYANRKKARFIEANIRLSSYVGTAKQLALIFGFDVVPYPGSNDVRVLIYTDAGLVGDQKLASGDNQLLLEFETIDRSLSVYFIHAGGTWYFKGLSGYVV